MGSDGKRKIFKKGAKNWHLSALAISTVLVLGFYIIFELVPYYAIFLTVNFVFLYIELVYLLKFKEEKEARTTKETPSVTILVPIYNSAKTLEASLRAVQALKYPKKIQVIAIEDASTDSSNEILRNFRGIEIIRTKKNIGKAASLNLGLGMAKGDLVATIDSDTYPQPDALLELVRHFTNEKVGASIGMICVNKPKNLLQKIQEVEYYVGFGFTQVSYDRLDSLFITPGPLSVYRKSALKEIGGFDEDNIAEDMEVALNLKRHGYSIASTTRALAYTTAPATLRRLYRQRIRWFRGAIYNGEKYFSMLFNKNYGNFGKFVFPVSYIIQALSILVIARLMQLYLTGILALLLVLAQVIPYSLSVAFGIAATYLLKIQSAAIFYFTTLLIWGYVIHTSFGIANRKIGLSNLPAVLVFMTIYPFFLSAIWLISFIQEIARSEAKW